MSGFSNKTDPANLKSDVGKLDIDELKNVASALNSLKSKVDKLDIGKLETTQVDLSRLCNVVKKFIVKPSEYDELAKKLMLLILADLLKNRL